MGPTCHKKADPCCWQAFQHSNNLFPVILVLALIKRIYHNEASLVSLASLLKDPTKLRHQILRLFFLEMIVKIKYGLRKGCCPSHKLTKKTCEEVGRRLYLLISIVKIEVYYSIAWRNVFFEYVVNDKGSSTGKRR